MKRDIRDCNRCYANGDSKAAVSMPPLSVSFEDTEYIGLNLVLFDRSPHTMTDHNVIYGGRNPSLNQTPDLPDLCADCWTELIKILSDKVNGRGRKALR